MDVMGLMGLMLGNHSKTREEMVFTSPSTRVKFNSLRRALDFPKQINMFTQ